MSTSITDTLPSSDVHVMDDFISPAIREQLTQFFSEPIWVYGWRANSKKKDAPNGHWNVYFAGSSNGDVETPCEADLMEQDFLAPIQALWKQLKSGPLAGHELLRCYANAHTYGTDGYVHTDSSKPNYFSTVCYLHAEWHPDWAGETVFFDHDKTDVTRAVYPRPGRIVTFHGAVPHCARPLSRDCSALRISLIYKTRRI